MTQKETQIIAAWAQDHINEALQHLTYRQRVLELKVGLFKSKDRRLCACSYGARGPDAWDLFVPVICSSVIY